MVDVMTIVEMASVDSRWKLWEHGMKKNSQTSVEIKSTKVLMTSIFRCDGVGLLKGIWIG